MQITPITYIDSIKQRFFCVHGVSPEENKHVIYKKISKNIYTFTSKYYIYCFQAYFLIINCP